MNTPNQQTPSNCQPTSPPPLPTPLPEAIENKALGSLSPNCNRKPGPPPLPKPPTLNSSAENRKSAGSQESQAPKTDIQGLIRVLKLAGVGVVVLFMLGVVVRAGNELTRKDTAEDFTLLCACVFDTLPAAGAHEIQPTPAEAEVLLDKGKLLLSRVSRRARNLAPIAQGELEIIEKAQMLSRNGPHFSNLVFGTLEGALGLYSGQRELVGKGGQKALGAMEETAGLIEANTKLRN